MATIGLSGERLRKLREAKGFSQESFGEKIGVKRLAVSNYEKGKRQPTADILGAIADVLDTNADFLLGRTNYEGQLSPGEIEILDAYRRGDISVDTARLAQRLTKLPDPIRDRILREVGIK